MWESETQRGKGGRMGGMQAGREKDGWTKEAGRCAGTLEWRQADRQAGGADRRYERHEGEKQVGGTE